MNYQFTIETFSREELQDITHIVETFVANSSVQNGLINVYAQGATSGIMIQENGVFHGGKIFSFVNLMVLEKNVLLFVH